MFLAILSLLVSVGLFAFFGLFVGDPSFAANADLRWAPWGIFALGIVLLVYGLWKLNDETDVFSNLFTHLNKKLDERDERIAHEAAAERAAIVSLERGRGVGEDTAKAAAAGDAEAQARLAIAYFVGEQLARDYDRAVYWARRAYKKNDWARALLADCYRLGHGVDKDEKKAIKYATPAAENGNDAAQFALGWIYHAGTQVAHDYEKAVRWYEKAAAQGNSVAQNNLGTCYADGTGVAQDFKQAIYWYEKAVAQNDATAFYSLGLCYLRGKGVGRDRARAKELFAKAVALGYADAQKVLDTL